MSQHTIVSKTNNDIRQLSVNGILKVSLMQII